MDDREKLYQAAKALCDDFAAKKDVQTLLSHFTKTYDCTAIEHGEPALAPFLGRPYNGLPGVQAYFTLLAGLLTHEDMRFSEWIVDSHTRKVSVKGQAKFTWIETAQSWDETFTYSLDFDHEFKVTDYQVWADSGAAYLARIGKLDDVKGDKVRNQSGRATDS
ncbi:hypothetical protein HWV62_7186 [Athelia sp. TMB]|nr:hypothetical protein HWV62_7186 [Athelia sp. TMB]